MTARKPIETDALFKESTLKRLGIEPREKIGQNFLIDIATAEFIANQTIRGAEVLEIGSGPGTLTRLIAEKGAAHVLGVEIDPSFSEPQARVLANTPKVEVRQQDALGFKFDRWIAADPDAQHQVIGNIPYHISEPLVVKLAKLGNRLDNATLLVGDELADLLTNRNPGSERYSRLSFIAGVFDVRLARKVPKTSFWPQPRTESAVVILTPREFADSESQTAFGLRQAIVDSIDQNLTLAKVVNTFGSVGSASGKQLGKDLSHKVDRRVARRELNELVEDLNDLPAFRRHDREAVAGVVAAKQGTATRGLADRLGLPVQLLSKPFSSLNNQEVKQLAQALKRL